MKYIKSLILENFQSHKYTVLEFNEGLNVIVGPSDTGKSSIIRGIKWALYNEPSGDYFIRQGEDYVSVTLIFNDNTKLKRYRSKSKNQYIIRNSLGEETKYEGFGLNVPEEIKEKIGIEKIYLDSDETSPINLGEQLEGAFLLSEKTSTRASAIGRLIGVNIIDDTLKETLKDLRNLSTQKKNKDNYLYAIEEELKSFEYLQELNVKYERLEFIKGNIINNENKKSKLDSLSKRYIKYKEEIMILNSYLDKLKKTEELEQTIKDIEKININYKYLNSKNDMFKYSLNQINKNNILIKNLKGVNRLVEIQRDLIRLVSLKNVFTRINTRVLEINSQKKELENLLLKLGGIHNIQIKESKLNDKTIFLHKLITINQRYVSNYNSIKKGEKYICNFNKVDKIDVDHRKLSENIDRLIVLTLRHKTLDKYRNEKYKEKEKLKALNLKMEISLNKYKELLKKQEVCPLCLSNIDDEKVTHIMEHFK